MPGSGRIATHSENEDFMTIVTRLDQWKERGTISPEQHALLAGLSRGEPFSVFLELNILLGADHPLRNARRLLLVLLLPRARLVP